MEELTVGTRVEHPPYGEGIINKDQITSYEIFFGRRLTDEEKIIMQQYMTRIYASLTAFNILFAHEEHYFAGAKS